MFDTAVSSSISVNTGSNPVGGHQLLAGVTAQEALGFAAAPRAAA